MNRTLTGLTRAAALAALACTPLAHAGWVGGSATATLTGGDGVTIPTPFASSAVVGAGVEFSGIAATGSIPALALRWTITADIADDSISIHFDEPGDWAAILNYLVQPLITLQIGGLTQAAGLAFASYNCSSTGTSCSVIGSGPNHIGFSASETGMQVSFNALRDGETYVFSRSAAVPEPAGIGLAGLALLLATRASRRRA